MLLEGNIVLVGVFPRVDPVGVEVIPRCEQQWSLNVDGNTGKGGSISEDDAVEDVVLALEMEKVGWRVFGRVCGSNELRCTLMALAATTAGLER